MFFGDHDGNADGKNVTSPISVAPQPVGEQSLVSIFKGYWDDARDGAVVPERTAINPASLDAALPFSFVGERVASDIIRLRVAGNRLSQLLGMDARGMPLCSFFTPKARDILGPVLEQVMSGPTMAEMRLTMPRGLTRTPIDATMVLLPLQGPHGQCDRVLGAIFSDFVTSPSGAKFDIDPRSLRIEPVNDEQPKREGHIRLCAVGYGSQSKRPPAMRTALRLVVNNG